ncbi:hypothetical protein ACKWTF_000473 [Chironomus riparius]
MEDYLDYQAEIEEEFGWAYYQKHPIVSFWNVVLPILSCSIGIIGNAIVCALKLRKIKSRSSMDLLVITYSLSLILSSIWSVLVFIEDYFGASNVWFCQLKHSLTYLPIAVSIPSIFSLIIISKYYAKLELKIGLIMNIVIWIYGLIRGYPYLNFQVEYFKGSSEVSDKVGYCQQSSDEHFLYFEYELLMFTLDYILPIFGLFIVLCLLRCKASSPNQSIFIYGIINSILFYLGIVPSVLPILHYLGVQRYIYHHSALAYFLNLIVLPVNPFLLYYYDPTFKKDIRVLFKRSTDSNDNLNLETQLPENKE